MPRAPRLRALAIALAAVSATAAAVVAAPPPASASGLTLTVNVGTVVRPVSHVAAGGLYGVDTGTNPPLARIRPLHVNTFTQPPPGTQQLGNGATHPCCDGLEVADKMTRAGGQEYLRLPDIFSAFPYNWVSWADWESKIRTMITARMGATGTTGIKGYEIWNEPDCNWDQSTSNDPDAGSYLDMWTRTYRDIRAIDDTTPIVGPGACVYNHDWMYAFMEHARDTGTLPGVAVWHELQDFSYGNVQAHVDDFRGIEDSLGLPHIPISINEYASPGQVDIPSIGVHYMAAFERAGVSDAERAYWYEAGTLNGLLFQGKPTASYWAYKWYGDQTGTIVQTVPQSWLDGVASYDASSRKVNVVFGGDSGTNDVVVNGLDALGAQVRVRLLATDATGRSTNEAAPHLVSTSTYRVVGGSIDVPVARMDAAAAYQLLVTPVGPSASTPLRYEAENATVANATRLDGDATASDGGYVGRLDNATDMRTDSFVDFLVKVPSGGTSTMTIAYANGTGDTSTQGLSVDSGPFSEVSYPATTSWGVLDGRVTVPLDLSAGWHVIRLAKGSTGFTGGTGYAELDFIQLG